MRRGQQIHRFDFSVVKMWEIPTAELWEKDLPGLLPLLPLTHDGARRDIIEGVIERLAPPGQEPLAELLALTYGLASLAMKNESDQDWLVRRFAQMYDMLNETRAYRELIHKGMVEGLEKGRLETAREILFSVMLERFPQIAQTAKGLLSNVEDVNEMRYLAVKMSTVQTAEEALQYIRKLIGESDK